MNLIIKELSIDYKNTISNFQTYETELKRFLIEDAINDQNQNISKTFLLFNNNYLVGYITLLCDSLRLEGDLKDSFKDKNIVYKSLPALKIGRLAVDDRYQRQGFGQILVKLAFISAKKIYSNYCGCRFLILDAKHNKEPNKDSIHFYKKLNFRILKDRIKGTTPMYLDTLI
ncbi:MAG: GNAT family N-acetyltransferase [archaeon]|jgi:ribosomal protein S18 acetylase RimI-like enzyme